MTASTRAVVKVRIFIADVPPETRTVYRALRRAGLSRRDANFVVWGVVIGSGRGHVDVREEGL